MVLITYNAFPPPGGKYPSTRHIVIRGQFLVTSEGSTSTPSTVAKCPCMNRHVAQFQSCHLPLFYYYNTTANGEEEMDAHKNKSIGSTFILPEIASIAALSYHRTKSSSEMRSLSRGYIKFYLGTLFR